MPEHSSPCGALQEALSDIKVAEADKKHIIEALTDIKTMLKAALEDGADRERRLSVVENTCVNCEKKQAAFAKAMWSLIVGWLVLAAATVRDFIMGGKP